MRILMPSIVDPAEKRGGSWAVTDGLLKAMKVAWPHSEIDCIALSSRSRAQHKLQQLACLATSVLVGGMPAKMRFTQTRDLRRRVHLALEAGAPDLIILNGADLLWLRRELPRGIPVIVVAHNLEFLLYDRQLANMPAAKLGIASILRGDLERLREMELEGLSSALAAIFLSDEDLAAAREASATINAVVVPPSFDYEAYDRRHVPGDRLALGMFANFEWWPNRISLEWFITNVWPSVCQRCDLHLIGHGSERTASEIAGVSRHGYVRDPRDAFAMCDLMIAPITDGAGVKIKVAEALYNGVPVVATPAAVCRLFANANPALKVCSNEREWIEFLTGTEAPALARETVPVPLRNALSVASAAKVLRSVWPA